MAQQLGLKIDFIQWCLTSDEKVSEKSESFSSLRSPYTANVTVWWMITCLGSRMMRKQSSQSQRRRSGKITKKKKNPFLLNSLEHYKMDKNKNTRLLLYRSKARMPFISQWYTLYYNVVSVKLLNYSISLTTEW